MRRFRQDYRQKRRRQALVGGSALIPGVIVIGSKHSALLNSIWNDYIGWIFLWVAAIVAFSFWNWRCPACSRYWGGGMFFDRRCPYCRLNLD